LTDGPEDLRRLTRRNLRAGADLIKLFISGGMGTKPVYTWYAYYSEEEIRAAVNEAARIDIPVAAHVIGGPGIMRAIECGVSTVEHAIHITDEECAAAVKKGTWFIFTTSITHYDEVDATRHPEHLKQKIRTRNLKGANIKLARKHGVRYAAGTDAMHGMMWCEAQYLVKWEVPEHEAILACTRWAAEASRVLDKVGTLEENKYADVIAVKGNPLENIMALRDVAFVMKGGEQVTISEL
jgi:imidazolonepropionase-like amidohydrolase